MSKNDHDALLADLRVLADTVLDYMDGVAEQLAGRGDVPDPVPEKAAAHADAGESGRPATTGCSWCPVCAVAALVNGENHELLTRLASQLAAFIALVRELLARYLPRRPDPSAPTDPTPPEPRDNGGGFVPISVTIRP